MAVFLGLVVTAMLRPPADLLARAIPRSAAVALSLIGSILVVLGALALVGEVVAAESGGLQREFSAGLTGSNAGWSPRRSASTPRRSATCSRRSDSGSPATGRL